MPVMRFGIFLAYGPTVDLQKEGLGRLLGAFLKAAAAREDVRFVIACPEWSKKNLLAFCESEGIPSAAFEFVSTDGVPLLLRIYLAMQRRAKPRKRTLFAKLLSRLRTWSTPHLRNIARVLVSARSILPWLLIGVSAAIAGLLLAPFAAIVWLVRAIARGLHAAWNFLRRVPKSKPIEEVAEELTAKVEPEPGESLSVRLYRLMEEAEIERMLRKINLRGDVNAWFSPTAFWPGFNRIGAPRLLCVPDVVLSEFPVGFAELEPELMKNFEIVEQSIRSGSNFVTYSSHVKWNTLVDRYAVNPDAVSVISHGSWDLLPWVTVRGFPETDKATRRYCERLLQQAFARSGKPYIQSLSSGSTRFLFYASQFRPNKNLLTLLRAYEYLVRERYLPHKLILTGDPARCRPVAEFIEQHHLSKDVVCLHGLSTSELAACYRLADLTINPSLSEGGFPFTLTEAISVGTPVVMARIPVTEEVLGDSDLGQTMLFDPYDWRDTSARIEWALEHRESLLEAQQVFCAGLMQRSWSDVVGDYVSVLERISHGPADVEAARK